MLGRDVRGVEISRHIICLETCKCCIPLCTSWFFIPIKLFNSNILLAVADRYGTILLNGLTICKIYRSIDHLPAARN